MAQLILPVNAGQLPSGSCPADYQSMANLFASIFSITFPSTFAGVTASATKPSDTTQAWIQLDSSGRPVRQYYFAQGAWLSQHTLVPGHTMIWFGALPNFATFDGGDANAESAISGPMWQQAEDASGNVITAKFLLTAGTLPGGTIVAVGDTGGEETHSLTESEMPPHTHEITDDLWKGGVTAGTNDAEALFQNEDFHDPAPATLTTDNAGGSGATPPVVVAHNNMPPWIGCYLLQRTNRLFYAVN